MIYNSNGSNTLGSISGSVYNSNSGTSAYGNGYSPKLAKTIKELKEQVDELEVNFNNFAGNTDAEIEALQGDTEELTSKDLEHSQQIDTLDTKVTTLEDTVEALDTEITTDTVNAGQFIFDPNNIKTVPAGKYLKVLPGTIVYLASGNTRCILNYTDNNAWIGEFYTNSDVYCRLYSDGVLHMNGLRFTLYPQYYVVGKGVEIVDDHTDTYSVIQNGGVTVGGTLYATLANTNMDTLTVNNTATISTANVSTLNTNTLNVLTESVHNLTATNETVTNLTATNETAASVINNKRNHEFDSALTGYISDFNFNPENSRCWVGIKKFTGTYGIKLVGPVNDTETTILTASIVWNGKNPIVQYYENQYTDTADHLYKIVLTDDYLYFVITRGTKLYYAWDTFVDATPPETWVEAPYIENQILCDYTAYWSSRTVFLGEKNVSDGIDIKGTLKPDILEFSGDMAFENLQVERDLIVGGTTTTNDLNAHKIRDTKNIYHDVEYVDWTNSTSQYYDFKDVVATFSDDGDLTLSGQFGAKGSETISITGSATMGLNMKYPVYARRVTEAAGIGYEVYTGRQNDYQVKVSAGGALGTTVSVTFNVYRREEGVLPYVTGYRPFEITIPNFVAGASTEENFLYYEDGDLDVSDKITTKDLKVTNNGEIHNLTADTATIENLSVTDTATIDKADIDTATIITATVTDGTITTLDSDTAQIDELNVQKITDTHTNTYTPSVGEVTGYFDPVCGVKDLTYVLEDDGTFTLSGKVGSGGSYSVTDTISEKGRAVVSFTDTVNYSAFEWSQEYNSSSLENYKVTATVTPETLPTSSPTITFTFTPRDGQTVGRVSGWEDFTFTIPNWVTATTEVVNDLYYEDGALKVSDKVEADNLYGKTLTVNNTGTSSGSTTYLGASSSGVTVNVNTTMTGNLTQTGNQTISGKVIIGDLD